MRSPYYKTEYMDRLTQQAILQVYDEKMPVEQVVITLISRRKSNPLRIIDPGKVHLVLEFIKQLYKPEEN